MSHPPSGRVIDDATMAAAADWIAARDIGFTAEEAASFERWRTENPDHEAALTMLEQTRELLEQMPLLRGDPALNSRMERLGRSENATGKILRFTRVLKIASALAACLAVSFVFWVLRPHEAAFEGTYVTAAGDYRRVSLPDNSELQLNANTRLDVRFSSGQRQITMAQGEAHFTVEKDASRPFLVRAGHVGVRAVGTAFNVRLGHAEVEVLVTEGAVDVRRALTNELAAGQKENEPARMQAGERVVIPTESDVARLPQPTSVEAAAVQQSLEWQNPLLVFNDAPLTEVVEKFNRHNRVQLELGDVDLRERAVGGTFRADQVESFVGLLEKSGDIGVERSKRGRIVLRKVAVPAER